MKQFLKHLTELSWTVGILLSVVSLLLWLPDFLASDAFLWSRVATLTLAALNGVLLMYVLYTTGVTRTRNSLPIFCYLLLVSSLAVLHACWQGQLAVLASQIVVLLLHSAYRMQSAVEQSFWASLLLCLSALLVPDMLFLMPLLWIGFSLQRAMSLRVWLASVIAIGLFALYYWLINAYCLHSSDASQLLGIIQRVWIGGGFTVEYIYLFAVGLTFSVVSLMGFSRENSRAQSLVIFMLLIFWVSGVLLLLPSESVITLMPVVALAASTLAAYYFSTRQTIASGVIFILYILCSVAIAMVKIYL